MVLLLLRTLIVIELVTLVSVRPVLLVVSCALGR